MNDISFWYPILRDIGMRTPATKLFYADKVIGHIVDGREVAEFNELVDRIEQAQSGFGGEAFLRTGQTSNKHEWSSTCHLKEESQVKDHLARLIEFSMMVDLPYSTFAVREMIDTNPITVAFRGMPIAREIRLFASKGKLICAHPYWPAEAFKNQPVTKQQLAELHTIPDLQELTLMTEYISRHFSKAWSIDFLQDREGNWWVTDMALASTSYHWRGCEQESISQEAS
jgi:hypothetical protein